jgi:hypothetical protein
MNETIQLASEDYIIYQGKYDLSIDALVLAGMRPIIAGDTYTLTFAIRDIEGAIVDLTDASIVMTVKYKYTDEDEDSIIQLTGAIATDNKSFTLTIADDDIVSDDLIRGVYDIKKIVDEDVTTLLYGAIEILPPVTLTVPSGGV